MQNQTKPKPLRTSMAKLILAVSLIVCLGALAGILGYALTRQNPIISPAPKTISAIEISQDKKSILNAETKDVIFTIDDANKYLRDLGYAYNPDTFQDTNAKYAGDCFLDAALSNNKDRIVFSSGCLEGDLPQAWIGVYDMSQPCSMNADGDWTCLHVVKIKFRFLIGGSGRNFVWSPNDKTIAYEADLGLSGMTETRTINAATGNILKSRDKAREILENEYNQETDNIPGEILKYVPAVVKKIYSKNGVIYLSLDILSPNPDFLPGITDFFINQSPKLREVHLDNTTKAYHCGAGPDNNDTTADVQYPIEEFINQTVNPGISYYFDIQNDVITSIYEQCLP